MINMLSAVSILALPQRLLGEYAHYTIHILLLKGLDSCVAKSK